jgi:hypothetical protein
MLDGNMCFGVHRDELTLRLGDEHAEAALEPDEDLWRRIEPAVDFASSLPPK